MLGFACPEDWAAGMFGVAACDLVLATADGLDERNWGADEVCGRLCGAGEEMREGKDTGLGSSDGYN